MDCVGMVQKGLIVGNTSKGEPLLMREAMIGRQEVELARQGRAREAGELEPVRMALTRQ
jgi:hypothetical protein